MRHFENYKEGRREYIKIKYYIRYLKRIKTKRPDVIAELVDYWQAKQNRIGRVLRILKR